MRETRFWFGIYPVSDNWQKSWWGCRPSIPRRRLRSRGSCVSLVIADFNDPFVVHRKTVLEEVFEHFFADL